MEEIKKTAEAPTIENEKLIAALAYFIFFLPLFAARESKFAIYHANQAFNLFLLGMGLLIINIIPILGQIISFFGGFFTLVLLVIGMINAFNGKEEELPVIGKYKIVDLK